MLRTIFTRRVGGGGASGFARWLSTAAQNNVMKGYLEYWDHIRFRKGWAKPQFESTAVQGLLEDAAEHSAAVYEYLDENAHEPRLRKRGGESIAFLSGVQYDPNDHPERFVRELVHSTLSDVAGYVEGLSTEKVDELMAARRKHQVLITKLENLKNELLWSTYTTKDKAGALLDEAIKTLQSEREEANDEQDPAEQQHEEKIKINVTSHVQNVKDLVDKTDIRWEKVKEDPSLYNEELKVLQGKCAESTSVLMKDLLAMQQEVQAAVAEGNPANEEVKEEILKIHNMLETVDEVSKRIQVLKTATENEINRQEAKKEELQERENMIADINKWVQTLMQTMSTPETWQNITIKPDFTERNRRQYSLISAYVPRLNTTTCEVNVNDDILMISGTCLPTKGDIEATIAPLIHTLAKNPMAATPLLERDHTEFANYLSKGKWGVFTKYYTLPTRLPSDAVRAHYADNVLSVAVPLMA